VPKRKPVQPAKRLWRNSTGWLVCKKKLRITKKPGEEKPLFSIDKFGFHGNFYGVIVG